MKIKITLGQSGKVVYIDAKDNNLSLSEVLLMIAAQYGEEWYGCSINKENGDFLCNAVKEYFDSNPDNKGKSVYEIALKTYVSNLKIDKGFFVKGYDYYEDGETWTAIDNIFEEEI